MTDSPRKITLDGLLNDEERHEPPGSLQRLLDDDTIARRLRAIRQESGHLEPTRAKVVYTAEPYGDIRTDLRRALACKPCAEYQAGERKNVELYGVVRAHACEQAPYDLGYWPMPQQGDCPCGCDLP